MESMKPDRYLTPINGALLAGIQTSSLCANIYMYYVISTVRLNAKGMCDQDAFVRAMKAVQECAEEVGWGK